MTDKTAQELLQPLIVAALRAAQCRALAGELERIAATLRAVGEAQARQQAKPPKERVKTSERAGKGGRPPSRYVRIEYDQRPDRETPRLYINIKRGLLYELPQIPERIDVQRSGGRLVLRPCGPGVGYALMLDSSQSKINASGARDLVGLDAGKYAATIEAGAIVVGDRID